MAFALDPAKPDEEEEPKSAYADLMPAGAPTAATPAASGAPAPRAAPATPGFVNFDRYMNANRDTANRMVDGVAGRIESKAAKVENGVQSAQKDLTAAASAATIQGPAAGAQIGRPPPTAAATQTQAITMTSPGGKPMTGRMRLPPSGAPAPAPAAPAPAPGAWVSHDELRANAAKDYTGPTTTDVRSRYDALLGDLGTGRDEAAAAGSAAGLQGLIGKNATAFDASLASAAGGGRLGGLKNRFDRVGGVYDTALKSTSDAVNAAGTTSGEAISKWDALMAKEEAAEADRTATATANKAQIDRDNATRTEFDQFIAGRGGGHGEIMRNATAEEMRMLMGLGNDQSAFLPFYLGLLEKYGADRTAAEKNPYDASSVDEMLALPHHKSATRNTK